MNPYSVPGRDSGHRHDGGQYFYRGWRALLHVVALDLSDEHPAPDAAIQNMFDNK